MNVLSTIFLAFAMSTDAFAAAVAKGAALHRPQFREALRTGLIFGAIEALTPLLGWALGNAASAYVKAWDHWLAFALLGGLGLLMIKHGFGAAEAPEDRPRRHSLRSLAATGFATSIDAMAVGAGLAFVDVDIVRTAVAIGLATLTMVTTGVMVGRALGALVGKRAEIVGGVVLIGVACVILHQHIGSP